MSLTPPIKVLVAKPGLDGHDRGAKVVSALLRDAGMEVIYTGLHQSIEAIVQSALDEDVEVLGLSIHSGAHLSLTERLQKRLQEEGFEGLLVLGGIIPPEDEALLKTKGVYAVFTPGTPSSAIVHCLEQAVQEKRKAILENLK
jgi:methylmalonyl-CoA mutase C-terminal domain/subunit